MVPVNVERMAAPMVSLMPTHPPLQVDWEAEASAELHIQELNLANNRLGSVPAELGELTSLRVLRLGSNGLHSLPAALKQLAELRELYLHNNLLPLTRQTPHRSNQKQKDCNSKTKINQQRQKQQCPFRRQPTQRRR